MTTTDRREREETIMKALLRENLYLRPSLLRTAILVQLLGTVVCAGMLMGVEGDTARNVIKLLFLCLEFAAMALLEAWLTGNHERNAKNGFYAYLLAAGLRRSQFVMSLGILYGATLLLMVAMTVLCQGALSLTCPGFWDGGGFAFMIGLACGAFSIDWLNSPWALLDDKDTGKTLVQVLLGLVVAAAVAVPVAVTVRWSVGNDLSGALSTVLETLGSLPWLGPLVCVVCAGTLLVGTFVWIRVVERAPICG